MQTVLVLSGRMHGKSNHMTNVPHQEWEPSRSEGDRLVQIQKQDRLFDRYKSFFKN